MFNRILCGGWALNVEYRIRRFLEFSFRLVPLSATEKA